MEKVEEKIYSTFSGVASAIGFSEVHGRVIAALLVSGKHMSLDDLTRKTGYSAASISLSIDLLELIGIVKRVKNPGDRKLYVKLEGDLLEGLRRALLMKINKNISATLDEFNRYKKQTKEKNTKKAIATLEKEMKRLERYIDSISRVKVPKGFV